MSAVHVCPIRDIECGDNCARWCPQCPKWPVLTPQPESLTKREVFAAMAMQGILAHVEFGGANDDQVARWSVRQADYLIAALNAAPTEPQS